MSKDARTRREFLKAAGTCVLGAALAGASYGRRRTHAAAREMLVYVGTYTSGASEGIYLYRLDLSDGALRRAGITRGVVNPSYLTLARGRRFLYAVNEGEEFAGRRSGAVSTVAIEPATGALRLLNPRPSM